MIEAYVMVITAAGSGSSILSQIREIEGVKRANVVAGEFDIVLDVEAETRQELLAIVTEKIQSIEGVGRTRTFVILE